ncbi:MAG: response regulator, partial [Cyanobacteria bacterium J06560_2]
RLRLMALVMLGILPPLWGAIGYASYRAANIFRVDAQENMAIKADALGEQIDHWHQKNTQALDALSVKADFATMERSQQLPDMLSTLNSAQTEVDAVVTVDLNGEVVAGVGTKPRTHPNYRHQPWFQSAAAGVDNSRVTLASRVQSPSKSDPTVIFSKPILAQPTLSVGDRNPKVAQLQTRLKNLNYYSGPIDGIYAGETVEAIQRFKQAYYQEDSAGIQVDPVTWQSIDVAGKKVEEPAAPSQFSSESVYKEAALREKTASDNGLSRELSNGLSNRSSKGPIRVSSPLSETVQSTTFSSAVPAAASEDVEGVVMIETQLDDIKRAVSSTQPGKGYALVLDESDRILIHSDSQDSDASVPDSSPEKIHQQFVQAAAEAVTPSGQRAPNRPIPRQRVAPQQSAVLPVLGTLPAAKGLSQSFVSSPAANYLFTPSTSLNFLDTQGQRWIAHREALANGWSVVLLQPDVEFSQEVRLFRHLSMVTGAIALLATAIAISLLSARLTQPILQLSNAANALSLGHLDQKVTVESHDEIGVLATAFNSVAGQLQHSFTQLADQNEALKRSDKLKDQFLANTSHELKTPLNGMIGIAESLLEGAAGTLSDVQRQNIAMIAASSHRLTRLVNDILDFSKLQHQQLSLHCKPLGVCASANVVLALSKSLVGNKPLVLKNNIPSDLPLVYADENRVQQILLNLVSNAIKFTNEGTIILSAKLVTTDTVKSVAVSVKDTGIGIADDHIAHIFQPFQQVENAAKSYGGTGLGLSISQHLARLHEGELQVDSVMGKGSTFTFTLPVAEIDIVTGENRSLGVSDLPVSLERKPNVEIAGSVSPELSQLRSLRKRATLSGTLTQALKLKKTELEPLDPHKFNILVVDDEPINVQVLKNHLSLENYTVTHALNGAAALSLLAKQKKHTQHFDLVILDVMMPRMSGYEVCQKLRETYPAHELPVVMLTAKNQVSDLITGFHFGANDYMTKPFSKDELLTRIKSHLRLSKTNHSYGRFVPSEYLRFLKKESIVDVRLGDHVSKEMAVMFSDIRSFTTLSESMTPQENFDFVNAYLRQVSPVIRDHQGFIVKYLGDGMMAVFPDGVDDAIASGVAKLRSVADYNHRRAAKGLSPIAVGIGIHFGHMMVGMVGESARMQGDAFSDNVNLTARLESLTKLYGVSMVVSGHALSLLSDPERYHTRFLDRVVVKGRTDAIDLYQVIEGESDGVIAQIEQTKEIFSSAIAYYQAGEFGLSKSCFEEILQQTPEDKTARLYCDRLTILISTPPEHWDGAWKLTQK